MKRDLISCLLFMGLLLLSTFLYRCRKPGLAGAGTLTTAPLNVQAKNAAAPLITSFVHPGVLNTQASLQFAAAHFNGRDARRVPSSQQMIDFITNHTYPSSL